MIDRAYPYRVVVPAEKVQGRNLDAVIVFHKQISQPLQHRSVFKDGEWQTVYGFVALAHASAFQAMFGGEIKKIANN